MVPKFDQLIALLAEPDPDGKTIPFQDGKLHQLPIGLAPELVEVFLYRLGAFNLRLRLRNGGTILNIPYVRSPYSAS